MADEVRWAKVDYLVPGLSSSNQYSVVPTGNVLSILYNNQLKLEQKDGRLQTS